MDRIDRKILSIFQNDTRRVAEEIGAEVGLSAAAVQRRLKKLRADRIIRAEIAQMDQTALGLPITCLVMLSMAANAAPHRQLDRFKREIASAPQVQQCYHVTGSNDFVLVVTASSMEEYAAFARQTFEENASIARYDTHVVLDRVKIGLSLPL